MPSHLFDCCRGCFARGSVAADAEITLIVVGLSNAGKTTVAAALQGRAVDSTPTVGFNRPATVRTAACTLTVYDVGGSRGIRAIWEHYWPEVHGVVFVVDAAADADFPEAAAAMRSVAASAHVRGKPVLVLANKQDLPAAASAKAIAEALQLTALELSSFDVMPCTAKFRDGEAPDPRIAAGLAWLEGAVLRLYATLAPRVARETELWRQLEDARKKQRLRNGVAAAAARRVSPAPPSETGGEAPSSNRASKAEACHAAAALTDGPEVPFPAWQDPASAPCETSCGADDATPAPPGVSGRSGACAGACGPGRVHSQPRPPRSSALDQDGSRRGSFAGGRDIYGRRSGSLVEAPPWLTCSSVLCPACCTAFAAAMA